MRERWSTRDRTAPKPLGVRKRVGSQQISFLLEILTCCNFSLSTSKIKCLFHLQTIFFLLFPFLRLGVVSHFYDYSHTHTLTHTPIYIFPFHSLLKDQERRMWNLFIAVFAHFPIRFVPCFALFFSLSLSLSFPTPTPTSSSPESVGGGRLSFFFFFFAGDGFGAGRKSFVTVRCAVLSACRFLFFLLI